MRRYDWWRWWVCTRPAPGYARGTLSAVLTLRGREFAVGFRCSPRDVEDAAPTTQPTPTAPADTPGTEAGE